eukprot:c3334_g1_i2.p1 GENE.c3334_g1_i2~~c3334_g1_i2.p1  ORF type:complete len:114 (+),score=26.08 c3334_g1_i2:220-561(+)
MSCGDFACSSPVTNKMTRCVFCEQSAVKFCCAEICSNSTHPGCFPLHNASSLSSSLWLWVTMMLLVVALLLAGFTAFLTPQPTHSAAKSLDNQYFDADSEPLPQGSAFMDSLM